MKNYLLLVGVLAFLSGCQSVPVANNQVQSTQPVVNKVEENKEEPQKVSVTVKDEVTEKVVDKDEAAAIAAANKDVALEEESIMTQPSQTNAIETKKDINAYPGYPLRFNTQKSDANVKKIQSRLNAIGYQLDVDGYFGEQTLNAVKYIQEQNHLEMDGIVGPLTWDALFNNTLTVEEAMMGDE